MSEFFDSLKISILGAKTSSIDREIDGSIQSIETLNISSNKNKYIEAIKSLISNSGQDSTQLTAGVQSGGYQQAQNYDQTGRINRYNEYDSIVSKISYCERALQTLTDHIISPDNITKKSLVYVSEINDDKNITKTVIARLKQIEKKVELENKISKIIRTTLKKGDYFVEILHSPKGQYALSIISESAEINGNKIVCESIPYSVELENDASNKEKSTYKGKLVLEYSSFGGPFSGIPTVAQGAHISPTAGQAITWKPNPFTDPRSKDDHQTNQDPPPGTEEDQDKFKSKFDVETKNTNKYELKDLFLTYHNPKHVIRLETERFRSCLGYLVFPKIDPRSGPATAFMSMGANSVDALCINIIDQLHKTLKTSNDNIKVSDDMRVVLLNYVTSIKDNSDLKVRYVPPEMMIHWRINTDKFDPYGESIFDCVNFDSRLLIALKTATTIKRLTSATDKRVISVETGLPRDAKNIIETLKESIGKKKISIDSMGSIDTIPSQIPTFESIYIPMRDGKKFVEFDKQEWGPNPNEDTEALKFIRDNIVANLGVPAPYLGLEENASNKSLLTAENINFCRTIIAYQKELSIPLRDLFEKIYKLVYPEDFDNLDLVKITFQEPKISPFEHQMEYIEQMQRLIEALKSLRVPVEWSKKKFLPDLDWDEIENFQAQETIKNELSESPPAQDELMGGSVTGAMY